MITDESYREYLRPGDLRTAEDALSWLRERAIAADEGFVSRASTLDEAHADLAARLDRERRQACRRAALYAWRMFSTVVRGSDHRPLVSLVFGADRNGVGKSTRYALASALHFRAEARRPR